MWSEEQEFLTFCSKKPLTSKLGDELRLLSQSTNKTDASLISIETTDLEDERIRITATFNVPKDATFLLEDLVNRIVIEKGILSLGWKKITDTKNIDEILEEDI